MDLEDQYKSYDKTPFKNPNWYQIKKELKQSRNQRLNKSLKQICSNEMLSKTKFNCDNNIFKFLIF